MSRVQAGLLLLALVPVVWAAMWFGWRGRSRRQGDVVALQVTPEALAPSSFGPADALYVGSVWAGDWLDRVVAHGLGLRSGATVSVHDGVEGAGVLVQRRGSPDLWVAAESLRSVRRDRGLAGKVVEADGLVVLRWVLGGREVDTGLRLRREHDRAALVAAVVGLGAAPGPTPGPDGRVVPQDGEEARG